MSNSRILVAAFGCVPVCMLTLGLSFSRADYVTPTAVVYRSVDDPDLYPEDSEAQWGALAMIDGLHGEGTPWGIMQDDTPSGEPAATGAPPITAYLVFDLGSARDLTGATVWARPPRGGTDAYGPLNVSFFSFKDDVPHAFGVSTDIAAASDVTVVGTQDLAAVIDGQSATAPFAIAGKRYVGMVINSSQLGGGVPTNIQIGEIAFNTVPEPSSVLLFVTGAFGLLAYAWRKRQ